MNIETANRLKKLRTEGGLSQEELAAKIGVTRQAVSKWERAEASPDTENLVLLAKLYGISIDKLLDYEPSGVSLRKEDYADREPQKELYPDNFTDEEVYPNRAVPQGSPFGESIAAEPENFGGRLGKAGITVGDALNSAGEAFRGGNWQEKFDKDMDKAERNINKGMNKLYEKFGVQGGITLLDKTFPILITGVFLVTCFIGLAHPGWTLFLLIPLYYTGKAALRKRDPMVFCYPALCALVYFLIWGILGKTLHNLADNWAELMWILFLTIPLYYTLFPAIRKRNPLIFCYPVLAVMVYIGGGIFLSMLSGSWGGSWFALMWIPVVVTIPLYYIVFSHYRKKNNP